MKYVLLIAFLISGFAMTESFGQAGCNPANCKPADCKPANCKPCPPGCCIISCKSGAAASSAASVSALPAEITFASWVVEGGMPNCDPSKMTGKERQACMAACKSAQATCAPASASTSQASCKGAPKVDSETNTFQASAVVRH